MDLYFEKEQLLKKCGFNKEKQMFHFKHFDKKGCYIDYFVNYNKENKVCSIFDNSNNLLSTYETYYKNNHNLPFNAPKKEVDFFMCQFLNIDYNKYKFLLTHRLSKDEIFHCLTHNCDADDIVSLPISYLYTDNSSWSSADIFKGFIDCYKRDDSGDFEELLKYIIDYLFFDESPNILCIDSLDKFLTRFSSSFVNVLSDDEKKSFGFHTKHVTHWNKYFIKTLEDKYMSLTFEHKPIFEEFENLTQDEINDLEPISFEYKFTVTPKEVIETNYDYFNPDISSCVAPIVGTLNTVFAMQQLIKLMRSK